MAITFVACTKLENPSGASASGSVSATGGNALICTAAEFSPGTGTLTVSGGGTWTTDHNGSVLNTERTSVASCPSATGGSVSRTVTFSAGSATTAFVLEFSGLASSGLFEGAGTTNSGSNPGSGTVSTNALTNTGANAVKIAQGCVNTGNNGTWTSTGTGWTLPTNGSEGSSAQFASGVGYKIVSASQSDTETWTFTTNGTWVADIRTYLAAGGAAQDTPELYGRPYGTLGAHGMQQLLAT